MGEIGVLALVILFFTLFQTLIFNIPDAYYSIIWLGNIILVLITYFYTKNLFVKEYEEKIFDLEHGVPNQEEFNLYKTELEQIDKNYNGEEWWNKQREFIMKKRIKKEFGNKK
ncbi:hypothetical protein ACFL58_04020 [Elusimicrobiota bacterium]